jgi:DNA-binding response OmpR family regulator|nr:MAG: DNA-binding response regulator [Bacteroidota bacterium]
MNKTRLLIVEDDQDLAYGLRDFFEDEGFSVSLAFDGPRALACLRERTFDLIILDVMLPGVSGFELLRRWREEGIHTPVLLLTAKGQEADKIEGFRAGADDYVTKPFSAAELLERVRAILRRAIPGPLDVYTFGNITVNFTTHTAYKDNQPINFTALEFAILKYLIEHRGRSVSRQQLLRDVWQTREDLATRTIDRHIASLRKKIEDDADNPRYIATVYGVGYKFLG